MSCLPKPKTDIKALVNAGYVVTYSDSEDSFDSPTQSLDLHDCFRETVTKNGIVCSPEGDKPSIKWFDNESGKLVAAAWYNEQGQFHRVNAPAFVCERSPETGASGKYTILGYLRYGAFHNPIGAAHICDDFFEDGRSVRTSEGHYLGGTLVGYIRRDGYTGKIIPEASSPIGSHFPQKPKLYP